MSNGFTKDDASSDFMAYRQDGEIEEYKKELLGKYGKEEKPQEPPEGLLDAKRQKALDLLAAGVPKDEIEAEWGESAGLEIPWYDPVDVVIDIATGGISAVGRKGVQTMAKGATKEGSKVLMKSMGREVGFGTLAGGFMTAADIAGAGPIVSSISGLIGPTATAGLLTMSRKGLGKFMAHLSERNRPVFDQIMGELEKHADNPVVKNIKQTLAEESGQLALPKGKKAKVAGIEITPEQTKGAEKKMVRLKELMETAAPKTELFLKEQVEDLPKREMGINFGNLDTAEDIKKELLRGIKVSEEGIRKARRGKVSHAQTQKVADLVGMSVEQLLSRRKGQAFNDIEGLNARRMLVASAEKLHELASKVRNLRAQGINDEVTEYAFRKQFALHQAINEQVSGGIAESARAVSAFRIEAGPGGSLVKAKQIGEILGTLEGAVSTEKLAEMVSVIDNGQGLNVFAKHVSEAASKGRRTWDMFYEAWINGLLSGPQTHAVNTTSNMLVALWQLPERLTAAGFGKVLRGQGEVSAKEVIHQSYGMINGFKDGLVLAAKAFKSGEPEDVLSKVETQRYKAISGANMGLEQGGVPARAADLLGNAIRLPTRALMTEDEFFKSIGYRMELHAQAFRQASFEGLSGDAAAKRMQEIINDPPDNIRLAAVNAARYQTFTNELGKFGKAVQKGLSSVPALRIIVPFVRTPTNIIKFAGERTPVGLLMSHVRADIAAGGARRDLALARISLGSMLFATAATMASAGYITGGGPSDGRMRQIKRNTGWQPYSVKVGDKYYSFNRIDPIGSFLGMAADITDIIGQADESTADEMAAAAVIAFSKNVTSKTWLRGVSDVIRAFEDPDRNAERWLQSVAGTLIPTGVAQIERTLDPTLEDANSIVDRIKSRIPGYSKDVPARVNLWGEPIVLEGGLGPDLISPIYTSKAKKSPVDEELIRLNLPIGMPAKQIGGVPLTEKEYHDYVVLAGNKAKDPNTGLGLKDTLEKLISSSEYQQQSDGPDGGKALIIRQYIHQFRELAKFKMQEKYEQLGILIQDHQMKRFQMLQPGGLTQ